MAAWKNGDMVESEVWGGRALEVTQGFGPENTTADPAMYQYSASYGFPAGVHIGVDIGMDTGQPIYAAEGGTVEFVGDPDEYSTHYFTPYPVVIRGEKSDEIHIYGHLWRADVEEGQRVEAGKQLGISGEQTRRGTTTPDGTGQHLHFERRKEPAYGAGGQALDPAALLGGAVVGRPSDPKGRAPSTDGASGASGGVSGLLASVEETAKEWGPRIALAAVAIVLVTLGAMRATGASIASASPAGRLLGALT